VAEVEYFHPSFANLSDYFVFGLLADFDIYQKLFVRVEIVERIDLNLEREVLKEKEIQ